MNIFSLQNKTIVLTGAAGFFGKYFSRGLLEFGAKVILVDKTEKVKDLENKLKREFGERVVSYIVDFYDKEKTINCFNQIIKKEKKIDVLVNNAFDFSLRTGFNDDSGRIENATYEQLKNSFESGVYWAILATQVFSKSMSKTGGGAIINICSMYSLISPSPDLYKGTKYFNPPGYSIVKAGLLAFTRYAASFYAPHIRVNAILPGAFPNLEEDSFNAVEKTDEEFLKRLKDRTLLKRVGQPKDLIGVLVFLASDASAYLTGQAIIVDGGWTVT